MFNHWNLRQLSQILFLFLMINRKSYRIDGSSKSEVVIFITVFFLVQKDGIMSYDKLEDIIGDSMKIDKRHLLNYSILVPYLILSVIGLIVVYSTTSATLIQYGANPFASVLNQGVFWIISLVAILFIYKLKLNFLKIYDNDNDGEVVLLLIARFLQRPSMVPMVDCYWTD